jgi:predicted nucleotidyltransferase
VSLKLLDAAAAALDDLCARVVFLGGATMVLWMTDPGARPPRVTYDVDVVADVVTLADYEAFQAELRSRRFSEDAASGVICRWRHAGDDLVLDAIPLEARLTGFGGRWLRPAAAAAVARKLPSGTTIRVVPPAYLLATKLEAFADRGQHDLLASRDFEDVIVLTDSRTELLAEVAAAPADVRQYVRTELAQLALLPSFEYGVEGALTGPGVAARVQAVTLPRLRQLAGQS